MNKKLIYKGLILLGLLPVLYVLVTGIYQSITGFSFCLGINCPSSYGFEAFFGYVLLFSFVYWPLYLIGLVVSIIGIYLLLKKK